MLFRIRPTELLRWPAWELDLVEHYLAKQPAAEDRVEIAVARMTAIYANAHRGRADAEFGVRDFLPYLNPEWDDKPRFDSSRYNDVDRSFLEAFGAKPR